AYCFLAKCEMQRESARLRFALAHSVQWQYPASAKRKRPYVFFALDSIGITRLTVFFALRPFLTLTRRFLEAVVRGRMSHSLFMSRYASVLEWPRERDKYACSGSDRETVATRTGSAYAILRHDVRREGTG